MQRGLALAVALAIAPVGAACGSDDSLAVPDASSAVPDADLLADAVRGPPSAAQLLAALGTCDEVVGGLYAQDSGGTEAISICGVPGAVFWAADLDVDCDGRETATCNVNADPDFLPETSGADSHGDPLDAAALPFVVLPSPSSRWRPSTSDLHIGSVVAVIFDGRVEYAVYGDSGPVGIIGEASYRMAELLGIDPDPATGGIGSGVTYVAFPGDDAVVAALEDHEAAVAIGIARARALIASP